MTLPSLPPSQSVCSLEEQQQAEVTAGPTVVDQGPLQFFVK